MWRIIDEGLGTMHEIETFWNFDDILEALSALELKGRIASIFAAETKVD